MGVAVAITPWNFPVVQVNLKIALAVVSENKGDEIRFPNWRSDIETLSNYSISPC